MTKCNISCETRNCQEISSKRTVVEQIKVILIIVKSEVHEFSDTIYNKMSKIKTDIHLFEVMAKQRFFMNKLFGTKFVQNFEDFFIENENNCNVNYNPSHSWQSSLVESGNSFVFVSFHKAVNCVLVF